MVEIGEKLDKAGFGFTCDTKNVLSMGESTKVHCTYIEDPDRALIEMIEVYKIPIIEKLGINLNVEKSPLEKPLPDMLLKALKFSKVKDYFSFKLGQFTYLCTNAFKNRHQAIKSRRITRILE